MGILMGILRFAPLAQNEPSFVEIKIYEGSIQHGLENIFVKYVKIHGLGQVAISP